MYFWITHPFEVRKPYCPSYGWKNIWTAKSLVERSARRVIGRGSQTLFLNDKWIPDKDPRPTIPVMSGFNPDLKVMELIDGITNSWNLQRLREYVDPTDTPLILSLRLSSSLTTDGYCSHYTTLGKYTVKSGYDITQLKQDEDTLFLLQQPSINSLRSMFGKYQHQIRTVLSYGNLFLGGWR